MSQWIRQGSNQEILLDILPAGERVMIQGSNGFVKIKGDVGGTIIVQGSNGMVKIGGIIRQGARVTIQGSNPLLKHHGMESGATVVVQGSNAKEIGPKDPPDRSGLEFGTSWGSMKKDLGGRNATSQYYVSSRVLQVQKSHRPREQWGT